MRIELQLLRTIVKVVPMYIYMYKKYIVVCEQSSIMYYSAQACRRE